MLINTDSSFGKVELVLLWNTKRPEFLKENCKVAWNREVNKYASHNTPSLLKLKSEFHNSKFNSAEKDLDEWISYLQGIRIWMSEFSTKGTIKGKILWSTFSIIYMMSMMNLKNGSDPW